MFTVLKMLPVFALILLVGWGYHSIVIQRAENTITEQQMQIDTLVQTTVALSSAAAINEQTIINLTDTAKKQVDDISAVTARYSAIQKERDSYLSVFREHDLTNLARARPGLIEPRINNGTSAVLNQLELDSKEIVNAQ